ncbi:GreA/GreB family elongation factor [Arthrobacter agilis]|uniref:GreA/GreB family elongation factor n=1 Tax=Arthrobacter agilis TaxID=37921 RepID=UPI002785ECD4|nr:GreA/GreB family elongation factor [Arthrobacter agilis]MDQ0736380.1 transcription elongation factor GreA [Arthrobacter agilis]
MLHPMTPVTWLTPDAHARLEKELGELLAARGTEQEIADRLAVETRIRQLMAILKDVRLHSPADDGIVEPGMLIEASIDGRPQCFLMGSREIFGDGNLEVFSERSPLGVAIRGLKPGDETSYTAPGGSTISVSIISARPYRGSGSHPPRAGLTG